MSSGSATKSKKLTREDELLQQFSNNVTSKNSALFYGNAIIVSALPICKLIPVHRSFPIHKIYSFENDFNDRFKKSSLAKI